MSQIRYEDVLKELLNHIPEFTDVFQAHLAELDEVLLYVLFGDLRVFLVDTYRALIDTQSQSADISDLLQRIIAFAEYCAESEDGRVVNLVAVGLLENLGWAGPDTQPIVEMLGPKSRKLWEQLEAFWEGKESGEI